MSAIDPKPAAVATPAPPKVEAPPPVPALPLPVPVAVAKPVTVAVTQMPPDDKLTDWVNIGVSGTVGLVAALLGAYIGYLLTKKSSDDARERDEREKNNYASFVMMQKLGRIYSRLTTIQNSFADAAMKAHEENQLYIFNYARPGANKLAEVHFSLEDVWRTGRMAGHEYVNTVTGIDEHFNSLLTMLDRYERERDRVVERLIPLAEANDIGFECDWDHPEIAKDRPKYEALDSIIASIIQHCQDDRPKVRQSIIDLHKGTGRYLKKQYVITMDDLDGKPERILALDEDEPEERK